MSRDQGSSGKMMNDEKFKGIHPKQALVGLTRLNWTPFGANDWEISMAMSYVTQILLNLMEINRILKMIVFGSGRFTNDIINLKHQGACQQLMIG